MFFYTVFLAIAAIDIYRNILRPSNWRTETETDTDTVPEPQSAAKNPQPRPVVTAPKPHAEKSKVVNVVPEPKQGEKKQPKSKNPLPESKPEGKKAKSPDIPPGSTRPGDKPKSIHPAPQPHPEGKKGKTICCGPELVPQRLKPKSNPVAPQPKAEGKNVKGTHTWCGTAPTPQGEKRKSSPTPPQSKSEGKKVKTTFTWCGTKPTTPQGEKRKSNHPAPQPEPEGKKTKWTYPWSWFRTGPTPQGEKRKSISTAPEPKPEGKKQKTTHPVTESKGQGQKRKASPTVPDPKHEGKKAKTTSPLTESKGQGENPKSNPMAPTPKRGGKKVKSKANHWTGGPALARHIPWPEIFTHHVSNIEGHFRMLDMVRKHTNEGSGNYRTISEMIGRTNEILRQSKDAARSFVPAADQLHKVPLGSSSDSMYPGYSPGDIEYGKASEEYGKHATDAKKKGIDTKSEDAEYKVGQSKAHSRLTLAQMQALKESQMRALKEFQDGPKSSPAKDANGASSEAKKTGHKGKGQGSVKASSKDTNPVFFTDTKPTPVNLPRSSKEQKPSAEKKDGKKSKDTVAPKHTLFKGRLYPPNPAALFKPKDYGPPPIGDPYLIPKQKDPEKEKNRLLAIEHIEDRIKEEQFKAEYGRMKSPKKRKYDSDNSFENFVNPATNELPSKGKKVRLAAGKGTEAGVSASKKGGADDVAGEKRAKKAKDAKDGKDGKAEGEEKPAKKRKEKNGEGKKSKDAKEDGEGKPLKKRKGKDGEGKVVADPAAKDENKRLVDTDVPDVADTKDDGKKKRRKVTFA